MTPVEVEYLRRYILNQPSFDITKVPGGALEVPEDVPSTYETFSHMPNWYLKSETYFGHRVYDLHGNFFTGRNWLKPLSAVFNNHETAPVRASIPPKYAIEFSKRVITMNIPYLNEVPSQKDVYVKFLQASL